MSVRTDNHRLTPDALADALAAAQAGPWVLEGGEGPTAEGGVFTRTAVFADFAIAFTAVTEVALAAERLAHHPDWSQRWNRVDFRVSSHDLGGPSRDCLRLMAAIDAAVERAAGR